MTPSQIADSLVSVQRFGAKWRVVLSDDMEQRFIAEDPRKGYCDNFAAAVKRIIQHRIEQNGEFQFVLREHKESA